MVENKHAVNKKKKNDQIPETKLKVARVSSRARDDWWYTYGMLN